MEEKKKLTVQEKGKLALEIAGKLEQETDGGEEALNVLQTVINLLFSYSVRIGS